MGIRAANIRHQKSLPTQVQPGHGKTGSCLPIAKQEEAVLPEQIQLQENFKQNRPSLTRQEMVGVKRIAGGSKTATVDYRSALRFLLLKRQPRPAQPAPIRVMVAGSGAGVGGMGMIELTSTTMSS